MPDDHADTGAEESISNHDGADTAAEQSALEAIMQAQQERKQAAIDQVTFRECMRIRAAGERYRDHRSLQQLRAEFVDHWKTLAEVREALQMYYLVYAEPPRVGDDCVFDNGYQFFVEGASLSGLNGETKAEAKEDVRRFVGRAVLDGDVESVDLDKPVPDMGLPLSVAIEKSEVGEAISIASVPELEAARGAARELLSTQPMLDEVRQSWNPMVARELGNSARAAFQAIELCSEAMPSSRTLAAGITAGAGSSLVATQGILGVEPLTFRTLGQPALQSAMEAMTAFSEVYEPQLASMLSSLSQDFACQLQLQADELARIPALQISELIDDQFHQQLAHIARQIDDVHAGVSPAAVTGSAATTVVSEPVLSQPRPTTSSLEQSEPMIGPPLTDPDLGNSTVGEVVWAAFSPENVEFLADYIHFVTQLVLLYFQLEYPQYRVPVAVAEMIALLLLMQWKKVVIDRR